jgi:hypothetical protein
MTADYSKLAIYEINAFLWQSLQDAGLLTKTDYYVDELGTYITPIIPAQQIPEFNNLLPGKTYIVYDYQVKPYREHFWITDELVMYSVLSTDYDKISLILNFIQDLLRRFDESAKSVNTYNLGKNSPFKYHYINIEKITSPLHFQNEGGFMLGEAIINYSYVRNLDSSNRYS